MSTTDNHGGTRREVLHTVAGRIVAVQRPHPIRVAIDGVDAAGKTTLADELVDVLQKQGRSVIRASIDGFHRPRVERHQRGSLSPEGYYHDSFDYAALCTSLLLPLGPNGDRHYRRAVFDYRADGPVQAPIEIAAPDAVLVVDGVFLLRPELVDLWDIRIFVDVDFSVTLGRAMKRDLKLFGTATVVEERYTRRYMPGQRLYLAEARPQDHADIIFKNDDPTRPILLTPPT
jgi:uridine kinase